MEQLVTIEIFGRPYTFKAESEATKAKEVVDFLKREITKVETQQSGKSPGITKLAILILAALNIANENFDLKMNHSELLEQISERSAKLIRKVIHKLRQKRKNDFIIPSHINATGLTKIVLLVFDRVKSFLKGA